IRVRPVVVDDEPGVDGEAPAAELDIDRVRVPADVLAGFEDRDRVLSGEERRAQRSGDARSDDRDLHALSLRNEPGSGCTGKRGGGPPGRAALPAIRSLRSAPAAFYFRRRRWSTCTGTGFKSQMMPTHESTTRL